VLGHRGGHLGDPLIEVAEIERLFARRRLANPLLITVVAERHLARALRDRRREIERRVRAI
jgi:hypothetical protein